MTPALEVRDLTYEYQRGRPVLRGISFEVGPNERLGIVGANGAGKSTLLWCILGLRRASGAVRLFGEPMRRSAWKRLGIVFQNPEDHLFLPRLIDDLTLPLLNRGVTELEARERALEVLRILELEGRQNEPAANLSLGLRKRAALAAALVGGPELLILDEPTAELDNRSRRRLGEHLAKLSIPCLITSHDLEFLGRIVGHMAVLAHGALAAHGPTSEILANTALLEAASLM